MRAWKPRHYVLGTRPVVHVEGRSEWGQVGVVAMFDWSEVDVRLRHEALMAMTVAEMRVMRIMATVRADAIGDGEKACRGDGEAGTSECGGER